MNKFGEILPSEVVANMRSSFDIDLTIGGHILPSYIPYLILGVVTILLIIVYVLINVYGKRRNER